MYFLRQNNIKIWNYVSVTHSTSLSRIFTFWFYWNWSIWTIQRPNGRSTVKCWALFSSAWLLCGSIRTAIFIGHHQLSSIFNAVCCKKRGSENDIFIKRNKYACCRERADVIIQVLDKAIIWDRYHSITWIFIHPSTSHVGGTWEMLIKATKAILWELL